MGISVRVVDIADRIGRPINMELYSDRIIRVTLATADLYRRDDLGMLVRVLRFEAVAVVALGLQLFAAQLGQLFDGVDIVERIAVRREAEAARILFLQKCLFRCFLLYRRYGIYLIIKFCNRRKLHIFPISYCLNRDSPVNGDPIFCIKCQRIQIIPGRFRTIRGIINFRIRCIGM